MLVFLPFSTTILLKNYRLKMFLGFLPHELLKPQAVQIDIALNLELPDHGFLTDDVNHVFNYQLLIDAVELTAKTGWQGSGKFGLQETFVQALANYLINDVFVKTTNDINQNNINQNNINKNFIKFKELKITTQKLEAYQNAESIGFECIYKIN